MFDLDPSRGRVLGELPATRTLTAQPAALAFTPASRLRYMESRERFQECACPGREQTRQVHRERSDQRSCVEYDSSGVIGCGFRHPDSQTVCIGIADFDFVSPRRFFDFHAKFLCERMNVDNCKI